MRRVFSNIITEIMTARGYELQEYRRQTWEKWVNDEYCVIFMFSEDNRIGVTVYPVELNIATEPIIPIYEHAFSMTFYEVEKNGTISRVSFHNFT